MTTTTGPIAECTTIWVKGYPMTVVKSALGGWVVRNKVWDVVFRGTFEECMALACAEA